MKFIFPALRVHVRAEHRRIKSLRREFPFLHDEFPRPINRFLLEIIAEAPVAEHLEKRVVISIEADIVEVVVFAAGADTLLRVRRATRNVRTFCLSEKNRDELVHAGIGEQKVRRVGHERTRRNYGVLFRLEEVEERLADLRGCHHLKQAKSLIKKNSAGERNFFRRLLRLI